MAIGERIRFFRNLRGMTQKYLGQVVGFPEKTAFPKHFSAGTVFGPASPISLRGRIGQEFLPAAVALMLCKLVQRLPSPSPCFGCYSSCRPTPLDR